MNAAVRSLEKLDEHLKRTKASLRVLCNKFDTSGDGLLSHDELKAAFGSEGLALLTVHEIGGLIEFLDSGHDGEIDLGEIEAAVRSFRRKKAAGELESWHGAGEEPIDPAAVFPNWIIKRREFQLIFDRFAGSGGAATVCSATPAAATPIADAPPLADDAASSALDAALRIDSASGGVSTGTPFTEHQVIEMALRTDKESRTEADRDRIARWLGHSCPGLRAALLGDEGLRELARSVTLLEITPHLLDLDLLDGASNGAGEDTHSNHGSADGGGSTTGSADEGGKGKLRVVLSEPTRAMPNGSATVDVVRQSEEDGAVFRLVFSGQAMVATSPATREGEESKVGAGASALLRRSTKKMSAAATPPKVRMLCPGDLVFDLPSLPSNEHDRADDGSSSGDAGGIEGMDGADERRAPSTLSVEIELRADASAKKRFKGAAARMSAAATLAGSGGGGGGAQLSAAVAAMGVSSAAPSASASDGGGGGAAARAVAPPKSKSGKIDPATAKKVQLKMKASMYGREPRKMFQRYDKSGDGALDAEELRQMIRRDMKLAPSDLPDRDVSALIRALDDDGGGSLSIDELLDFVENGFLYGEVAATAPPAAAPAVSAGRGGAQFVCVPTHAFALIAKAQRVARRATLLAFLEHGCPLMSKWTFPRLHGLARFCTILELPRGADVYREGDEMKRPEARRAVAAFSRRGIDANGAKGVSGRIGTTLLRAAKGADSGSCSGGGGRQSGDRPEVGGGRGGAEDDGHGAPAEEEADTGKLYFVMRGALRLHRTLTYRTANSWPSDIGDAGNAAMRVGGRREERKRRRIEYRLHDVAAGEALGEDAAVRPEVLAFDETGEYGDESDGERGGGSASNARRPRAFTAAVPFAAARAGRRCCTATVRSPDGATLLVIEPDVARRYLHAKELAALAAAARALHRGEEDLKRERDDRLARTSRVDALREEALGPAYTKRTNGKRPPASANVGGTPAAAASAQHVKLLREKKRQKESAAADAAAAVGEGGSGGTLRRSASESHAVGLGRPSMTDGKRGGGLGSRSVASLPELPEPQEKAFLPVVVVPAAQAVTTMLPAISVGGPPLPLPLPPV